ncbi:MAG: IS4 family transposase [Bacteroidetes bacterium]|nr:IS4 family transposase [Bacteroidota bacterium]
MTVEALLKLIPADTFSFLAAETKVNHQVKKLSGETLFKLILFSMLHSDKPSLRVMESFLQSAKFKKLNGQKEVAVKYNSIHDRICAINSAYFQKMFETIFTLYNKHLKEEKAISKADSTYVSIAANLVSWSMRNGELKTGLKQVKYSVQLKGSLPCHVKVFTEQAFISENLALSALVESCDTLTESVVVFDRGLQSRNSFDSFSAKDILFVGRSNLNYFCKPIVRKRIPIKKKGSTVTITKDEVVYLRSRQHKLTKYRYRLITARIDATTEEICLVTNLFDTTAYEIAGIYKQRWEIELFFRFIKQNLNVKHLVSRNLNGINVIIYMTMIAAILILVYKKTNQIKGYKIAKLRFEIALDNLLIKEIVILCGGNPALASNLWNSS